MREKTAVTIGRRGFLLAAAGLSGCASIGPVTLARDRVDYVTAIANSWKEQTLLNIVRLRYADTPTFLDVASVIGSYGLQGQVSAGGVVSSNLTNTIPWSTATLGANATYLDRPTISYTPLSGAKFARNLLRPIPPLAIFELTQAGYPVDRILLITTRALNGIYGRSSIGARARPPDPRFYPLLHALRRLQLSGAISLRLDRKHPDDVGALVVSRTSSPEVAKDLAFVKTTLNLQLNADNAMEIVAGLLPQKRNELAVLTRSMIEILQEIGSGIEVPQADITSGRALPSPWPENGPPEDRPLVTIHCTTTPPEHAFTAAQYDGAWYWIDDRDFASKGIFTFLMIFFSLAEAGTPAGAPVLTLPVN
jgi:hypothetical protein